MELWKSGFWGMRCVQVVSILPGGVDPAGWRQSRLRASIRGGSVGLVASSKPTLREDSPPPAFSAPPAQDGLEASLELAGEIVAVLKEILDEWTQCLRIAWAQCGPKTEGKGPIGAGKEAAVRG